MEKKDNGGPAFPRDHEDATGNPRFRQSQGMTLRDWFAGQALPAVIRQCAGDLQGMANMNWEGTIEEYFSHKSYALADAMLAARSTPQTV